MFFTVPGFGPHDHRVVGVVAAAEVVEDREHDREHDRLFHTDGDHDESGERGHRELVASNPEDLAHATDVDELDPDDMNTTDDSTALGMYWSGLVKNSRTSRTMTEVVSMATWLRPPAPSTIWVLVGLPLTTKVPESRRPTLARPSPSRSTFSSNASSYFAAYARDVAALWARITMKIANAVGSSSVNWGPRDPGGGDAEVGQAAGHLAERGHSVVGAEIERFAHDDGAHDRDQCTGDPRVDRLGSEDHHDHRHRHPDGGGVGVADVAQRLHELLDGAARASSHLVKVGVGYPEHPADLPEGNLDADAGEEADEHAAGEEVGDEPQLHGSGEDEDDPRHDREPSRECDVLRTRDGREAASPAARIAALAESAPTTR